MGVCQSQVISPDVVTNISHFKKQIFTLGVKRQNVEAMGSGVSVANEGDVVKDIEEVSCTDLCALY